MILGLIFIRKLARRNLCKPPNPDDDPDAEHQHENGNQNPDESDCPVCELLGIENNSHNPPRATTMVAAMTTRVMSEPNRPPQRRGEACQSLFAVTM